MGIPTGNSVGAYIGRETLPNSFLVDLSSVEKVGFYYGK
jgi:hypothetical protein